MSATTLNSFLVPPNNLFVYGTLMQGQIRHSLLARGGIQSVVPASLPGELFDLGEYPGLHLSVAIKERVTGELIEFQSLNTILAEIDEEEGAEFRREMVNVTTTGGKRRLAWTYVLAAKPIADKRVISSGNWRWKAAAG